MTPMDTRNPTSSGEPFLDSPANPDRSRYRLGRRAALVGMGGNITLAAIKGVLAALTGSIALWADAVDTAADLVTNVVVLAGMSLARRPADAEHPWGHGRAEMVASLIVPVLLGVAAIEFGVRSVHRIIDPQPVGTDFSGMMLVGFAGLVALTGLAKEAMARYCFRVGRRIDNPSIVSDGWQHRSDAMRAVVVATALAAAHWDVYRLDGVLGLGVSGMMLVTAWRHISRAASRLLGEAPAEQLVDRIRNLAEHVHGVRDVHNVAVHDYGTHQVASLHVRLAGGRSLADAHRTATEVEQALMQQLGLSALVHAEPEADAHSTEHEQIDEVRDVVNAMLKRQAEITGFHSISVMEESHGLEVEFTIHVRSATPIEAVHRIEHDLGERLSERFPGLELHVHVEPEPRPSEEQ